MFGTKVKVAAGVLAGAMVSGGLAFAAIPAADGSITACYTKQAGLFDPKGAVRLVDSPSQCRPNESAVSWNQQGQPGPAGSAGPAGPVGPSNAFYTAERDQLAIPQQGELTVARLANLPAGSYIFSAHTTAVNPDNQDWTAVRCGIRGAGQDSFGTWGSAAAVGLTGPASWFAQIFVSLPVTSVQPFDAELYCVQTRNATTAYVEESRLYAIKVGAVDAR